MVDTLTPFEVQGVVSRLLAKQPHLTALAVLVHRDDLWRLCREELQGQDVYADGWDVRPRWFGVVVVSTGRRAKLTGHATIEWRTVAQHVARQAERGGLT